MSQNCSFTVFFILTGYYFEMMKSKIFTLIVIAFLATNLQAQSSLNKLYRKFAQEENVTKMNLNGLALMFAKPFMEKFGIGNVTKVRVLSLEDCSQEVKEQFNQDVLEFNDDGYELFLNANGQNGKSRIYVKIDDELIREMVVMTTGSDPTLVHLKGKFRPSELDLPEDESR